LIARCDGRPIVWPEPTHGPGRSKPWRTAAEIIDWSLPCPSIFERDKPLAENTLRRIARGIQKFVVENPEPFILNYKFQNEPESVKHPLSTITSVNNHYLVTPFLSQYHGYDDTARGQTLDKPLLTVDTSNRYALVSAFISKFYKTGTGQDVREPLHTITTSPGHFAEVRAFLIKYYGQGTGQAVTDPLDTVVSKDRFGLVTVRGEKYQIVDIGMRMLTPKELYRAQGFPDDYIIDRDYTGKCYPKSEQVARCGNSVCPPLAEALVRANMIASKTYITTMAQLSRMVAV
jgi:DNA (cytosine-5)-methyltransferase 1